MAGGITAPFGIDTAVPSTARMYDWWLGGHDNFAADRAAALAVSEAAPQDARESMGAHFRRLALAAAEPGDQGGREESLRAAERMDWEAIDQMTVLASGTGWCAPTHSSAAARPGRSRRVLVTLIRPSPAGRMSWLIRRRGS